MEPTCKEVTASAPGKVILHGEHSVVYGKLALATSIDLRTTANIKASFGSSKVKLKVDFPDLKTQFEIGDADLAALVPREGRGIGETVVFDPNLVTEIKQFVKSKFSAEDNGIVSLLYQFVTSKLVNFPPCSFEVTVTSQIPVGAGLGSSAAFSVAISGAIWRMCDLLENSTDSDYGNQMVTKNLKRENEDSDVKKTKLDLDANMNNNYSSSLNDPSVQKKICHLAFLGEKILHGNPSGIDNSVCTYGGLLTYQSKSGMKPLAAPNNLKILLINTKVSRNTKVQVEKVKRKVSIAPNETSMILNEMDKISFNCLDTLNSMRKLNGIISQREERDLFKRLEDLIDKNQTLLHSLGVSHPSLDKIQELTLKRNIHSKLTGAGGGGFAFALLSNPVQHADVEAVKQDLENEGFDCWETQIGGHGVQVIS